VLDVMARGGTITIGSVPDVLTTSAAAGILGISRPTVIKMIRDGQLPAHRVGTHHRLKSEDVFAALKARRARERAAFLELMEIERDEPGER
jgi:excisionase family DNA binding protein